MSSSRRKPAAGLALWMLLIGSLVIWVLLIWHPWIDWFGRPR
jgi:hypothetical protein